MEQTNGSIQSTDHDGNTVDEVLFTYSEEEKQQREIDSANAKLPLNIKYLVVPMEVFRKGYTGNEALILAFIHSWQEKDGARFYFTNEQIGELFNITPQTVSKIIGKLHKDGEINAKRKMKAGGGQIRFIDLATSKNFKLQLKESLSSYIKKVDGSNNNIIKNNLNKNNISREVENTHSFSDSVKNEIEYFIEKGYKKEFLEQEIQKFILYWTEPNTKGKKRYEGEKYFDVKRRLVTWINRAKEWNPERATEQKNPYSKLDI